MSKIGASKYLITNNSVSTVLPADRHLVGGKSSGFIRADDWGATQCFHRWQGTHNGILLGHSSGSQGETGGDDSGQTFWDGSDGQSNSDLEIVDGTLDPGASVSGVVEVTNIDGPDGNADDGNDL